MNVNLTYVFKLRNSRAVYNKLTQQLLLIKALMCQPLNHGFAAISEENITSDAFSMQRG